MQLVLRKSIFYRDRYKIKKIQRSDKPSSDVNKLYKVINLLFSPSSNETTDNEAKNNFRSAPK